MNQLTVVEPGRLEWLDTDAPALQGAREAIVRPLAVATCDLDPMLISGESPFPLPIQLGHECVGEVVKTGEEVRGFDAGDLVLVPFQISCGECARCTAGRTGNCETVPMMSMYGFGAAGGNFGGALADLLRVPFADHMLVSLPKGLEPASVASVGDNVSDAWRTIGPYLEENGAGSVLVVGGQAESIGLYAAGMAVALGAHQVDYLDRDADRLERAGRLGASPVEGDFSERRGPYEITVDASVDPEGLTHALRSTAPDGVCTSVSVYFEGATLPLLEMYTKCITFKTGRCHARPIMSRVLELVTSGAFAPELVTSAVVPWQEAADVLPAGTGKRVVVRSAG